MGLQLSEVFDLDRGWYVLAGACIVGAAWLVRRVWAPIVTALILFVAGVVAFSDPDAWQQVGRVLGWLALPFLWPFGGSAVVLIPVMFREMFLPNAEFTLNPVDLRDLGPGGLVSFYLPWLLNEPAPGGDPIPYLAQGMLETGNGGYVYLEFELESYESAVRWHRFCKAVAYKKKNFSYNEAVKRHHLSDTDWDHILDTFAAQQWVILGGQRAKPELKAVGKHWVKLYADTPPPKP